MVPPLKIPSYIIRDDIMIQRFVLRPQQTPTRNQVFLDILLWRRKKGANHTNYYPSRNTKKVGNPYLQLLTLTDIHIGIYLQYGLS